MFIPKATISKMGEKKEHKKTNKQKKRLQLKKDTTGEAISRNETHQISNNKLTSLQKPGEIKIKLKEN